MKSSTISSAASSKTPAIRPASSSSTAGATRDRFEGRGESNCYFPGCLKDTNCNCKICLASINATLDLIPTGSSVTKISSLPKRAVTPPPWMVMEPETPPSTPDNLISSESFSPTPPIVSTAKSRRKIRGKMDDKGGFCFLGHWKLMVFVGILFLIAVDLGFLRNLVEGLGPRLTKEVLEKFVEESGGEAVDLRARLRILELKIAGVVDGEVLNCSSLSTSWKMKQVGRQLFHWKCVMYESMAEEVSVWGSPVPTSGLISTGFYSRSFTVLVGRIREWSDGKLEAISRNGSGSSWTLKRRMKVAMQLESNTWVVEYKRRAMFEDPKSLLASLEVLRLKFLKIFMMIKNKTSRFLTLDSASYAFYRPEEANLMHPT